MQNTYQEKIADLEVNNSNKTGKLEGGINFKFYATFQLLFYRVVSSLDI